MLYPALSLVYNLSLEDIAQMTPYAQWVYYKAAPKRDENGDRMTFDSEDEYQRWLQQRQKS